MKYKFSRQQSPQLKSVKKWNTKCGSGQKWLVTCFFPVWFSNVSVTFCLKVVIHFGFNSMWSNTGCNTEAGKYTLYLNNHHQDGSVIVQPYWWLGLLGLQLPRSFQRLNAFPYDRPVALPSVLEVAQLHLAVFPSFLLSPTGAVWQQYSSQLVVLVRQSTQPVTGSGILSTAPDVLGCSSLLTVCMCVRGGDGQIINFVQLQGISCTCVNALSDHQWRLLWIWMVLAGMLKLHARLLPSAAHVLLLI